MYSLLFIHLGVLLPGVAIVCVMMHFIAATVHSILGRLLILFLILLLLVPIFFALLCLSVSCIHSLFTFDGDPLQ